MHPRKPNDFYSQRGCSRIRDWCPVLPPLRNSPSGEPLTHGTRYTDESYVPDAGVGGASCAADASAPSSSSSADEKGPDAGEQLIKEFQELVEKAGSLGGKAIEIIRSHAELACFVASEKTRLFLARNVLLFLGLVMVCLSWLFLSMFLWRIAIETTGHWAAGPLVLLITHGAAGAILLAWRERLRL